MVGRDSITQPSCQLSIPGGEITENSREIPLIIPLSELNRDALPLAGGKGANLGEMIRAGLPVPGGFCVTVAAYAQAASAAHIASHVDQLAATDPADVQHLSDLARVIRDRIEATPIPPSVAVAVTAAASHLGASAPVAVRSSATAEDLPFASFAGQQETYLNMVGSDQVLEAVRHCWASLWTDRAVSYRARNGIDQRSVRLAVVVQRMVEAEVAGIMFTADPLTGRRGRSVIDASFGLGEAIVSGAVNPDHFVIDTATGAILERRLGDKYIAIHPTTGGATRRIETPESAHSSSLTDQQLQTLSCLGRQTEAHFGAPQDIEFAIDREDRGWLVQSRPITTLFPLPDQTPVDPTDLRVYFSVNVAQGVFRPFTPMGIQAFRLIGAAVGTLVGASPANPVAGPPALVEAANRLFVDITPVVRSSLGRKVLSAALSRMEARSESMLPALTADPRLALVTPRPTRTLEVLARILVSTQLPVRLVATLLSPERARASLVQLSDELTSNPVAPIEASSSARLDLVEHALQVWPTRILSRALPVLVAGIGSFALADRLLTDEATLEERDAVKRALPFNPTTEMDLALWQIAETAREDADARDALQAASPAELTARFRAGDLPPQLQFALTNFLAIYGHRAAAEIDIGMDRWSDDPTPLLTVLQNYLALDRSSVTPHAQFQTAATEAERTLGRLVERVAIDTPLRATAVRFLLHRGRQLAGQREMPKFLFVQLLARCRAELLAVGTDLVAQGRLHRADDIFFLTLPEARAALGSGGIDPRPQIHARRATYAKELRRRHVPRILLSDGTEPSAPALDAGDGDHILRGSAASAGHATGPARVVLDPATATIQPGEILVAPSTDPGWTPLFLTAGGLVMEMGGAMSHGAVVAREYGIPAVVGVARATERIETGQMLEVDGAAGTVVIVTG